MSVRIFIVDDNPVNLKLASSVLEMAGYIVATAVDAEQAQEMLKSITPDLILMDIALPGMDGLTLARALRVDPRLKHVPIVAMTAFCSSPFMAKARDAGCEGYITKPIDTRKLSEQLAAYLRQNADNERSCQ